LDLDKVSLNLLDVMAAKNHQNSNGKTLEKLSSNEIKPYIKKFLLEDENLIFQRLALHAIN
jgi:23S rRNA maturation-related 3'-5' exoribonuclease YhaM